MLFFICLNLVISYIVQSHHPFEAPLESVWSTYLGGALTVASALLMFLQKLPISIRYDLFCSGCLLIWISTWPPSFNEDSPVIFFYPIFFCFLTILVNIGFVQQASRVDALTLSYLSRFSNSRWFHNFVIMAGVLYSLTDIDNYRLFPTLMSIMILKFSMVSILDATHTEELSTKKH